MYPLNMKNAAAAGYAVANDEAEHQALSDAGYEPKLAVAPDEAAITATVEDLRAKLDAAGVVYDKRWGIEKLKAALPAV